MTIYSMAAIAIFFLFFVFDLKSSKGNRGERFFIRAISAVGGMALIASEMSFSDPCNLEDLIIYVAVADAVLLFYPCSSENSRFPLVASMAVMFIALCIFTFFVLLPEGFASYRRERTVLFVMLILVSKMAYIVALTAKKFSGIRRLFRNSAVWHNVEEYSRFVFSFAFLAVCLLALCSFHIPGDLSDVMALSSLVLMLCLFALLYTKAVSGRTFMLLPEVEKKIKEIIKGNLRTSYVDKAEEDRKMNNLYTRIMHVMDEKKPFLDSEFDMDELADIMYSNKLYLSRTINVMSGRNFRQFVNYHRIQYAMDLFKKDPKLHISEVSEMSGFHSPVSFNMSFKINTGKTPSEWLQEYLSLPR